MFVIASFIYSLPACLSPRTTVFHSPCSAIFYARIRIKTEARRNTTFDRFILMMMRTACTVKRTPIDLSTVQQNCTVGNPFGPYIGPKRGPGFSIHDLFIYLRISIYLASGCHYWFSSSFPPVQPLGGHLLETKFCQLQRVGRVRGTAHDTTRTMDGRRRY